MIETEYERTWEQNDDLGINDMKTDNYENDGAARYLSSASLVFKFDFSPAKKLKLDDVAEEKETDEAMAT